MVQVWLQWSFPELKGRKLLMAPKVVPLRDLVSSSISEKTTKECFTFFIGRKTRHVAQWLLSLKKGCFWFKDRLIYQGPKDVNRPTASENMEIFSCLQSWDLPCGGKMDTRNYQYGVEAYNPQFFRRQLGCPQIISWDLGLSIRILLRFWS